MATQNKKEPAQQGSKNMTQGSPFRLILGFSLPLVAGNALQQLYNMVDSMVVGRYVSTPALAAVGAAFPVIFLLASLFMGFGMGAMVMVSQYYGGGDKENLRRTIDTVYTALLVGGIPLCILGVLLTNPLLTLLRVPAEARSDAYIYLVIVLGGLLGSLGYNFNAGLLQGVGNSKTPLLFLTIACILNIVLDLLFVLAFGWGVAGVAIATVIAQFFSWIYGIFYINRHYPDLAIRLLPLRFHGSTFRQVVRLGLPAGIQQALFSVGTIMMARLVNGYGFIYAAGFNAANKLDTFVFLPIQSISTAITTFTGQNIGAGRADRVRSGLKSTLLLCLVFCLLGLLVIPFGPALLSLFNDDPAVIAAGMAFLNRILPFYWLLALLFVLNSLIRGAGEPFIPMLSSIISLWAGRVPTAYLFAQLFGRDNMHFSYAAGWVLGLLLTVPYFLSGRWRKKSLTAAENADVSQAADIPG